MLSSNNIRCHNNNGKAQRTCTNSSVDGASKIRGFEPCVYLITVNGYGDEFCGLRPPVSPVPSFSFTRRPIQNYKPAVLVSTMVLSEHTVSSSTKSHRIPLVTKGNGHRHGDPITETETEAEAEAETRETGMLFVFVDEDRQIKRFVCTDPVFGEVSGVQLDTSFITESMVEHMKRAYHGLYKDDEEEEKHCPVLMGFDFPLTDAQAIQLLYEYTATDYTKECVGGEIAHASFCGFLSW